MDYNDDELIEEKSFNVSDSSDDPVFGDDIDEPLEELEPLDGNIGLDDEEDDPDSHYH
ncbi:MAG: hypothetical protein WA101_00920 [Minisyncoccia bacterium]